MHNRLQLRTFVALLGPLLSRTFVAKFGIVQKVFSEKASAIARMRQKCVKMGLVLLGEKRNVPKCVKNARNTFGGRTPFGRYRKITTIAGNRAQLWTSTLSPHLLSPHFGFPDFPIILGIFPVPLVLFLGLLMGPTTNIPEGFATQSEGLLFAESNGGHSRRSFKGQHD